MRRFDSHAELAEAAEDFVPGGDNEPIDGITLIQEYVAGAQPFITRAEFIGGAFHYAVKVDISGGSFELWPADACQVTPGQTGITASGEQVVYDVNTNTNYNPAVESSELEAGRLPATRRIAQYLGTVLSSDGA
ncbi:hypothetical protein M3B43_03365 [Nesterenkonia massiliensis]|uniref:Uncharacterized protein n=1 Tax=Nesterenkonia massiliensis TaxID=1232429 RepID=A0ABT2HNW9_9MICC|nr:hypothetical protein [Nesterenkonia massiliensis]MCT1606378.1 hypothetical protein [Nesterenkonia massiliensis]